MTKDTNLPGMITYHIRIKGRLDGDTAGWFDECNINTGKEETILSLDTDDQSKLHGILAKIRDLGLELMGIERSGQ